jgi:hypothetical protein
VVIVVTAAGLLLRSIASSTEDYRRNLEDHPPFPLGHSRSVPRCREDQREPR